MTDVLTRATEALRDVRGDDDAAADATRLRLRRSLEERSRGGRTLSSWLAALGIGLGATTAFALATDGAGRGWTALVREPAPDSSLETSRPTASSRAVAATHAPATTEPPTAPPTTPTPPTTRAPTISASTTPTPSTPTPSTPTPSMTAAASTTSAPSRSAAPAPSTPNSITSSTTAAASSTTTTASRNTVRSTTSSPSVEAVARAERIEALFRDAHELHFRGGDPSAALVAWDAYLAAEPHGRFTAEARYNRALVLVRLGRFTDARTALAPFARGEVASGYRQDEARALLDRLAGLNDR